MSPINFKPTALAPLFTEFTGFHYMRSGSYKSVYQVTGKNTQVDEVLKVIVLPEKGKSEEDDALHEQELGRVQRETSILEKCGSPYVVKLGSVKPRETLIEGRACFAYTEELLPGVPLSDKIDLNKKSNLQPSEFEVKSLLFCLVSAVQNLWEQQRVVHRDIKPGNIFATGISSRPYVLFDLGIAYDVTVPGLTLHKNENPHTPLYVAPEILDVNFRETISYRSDLYSSALSAYEFAAGIHPLKPDINSVARTHTFALQKEPTPLEILRPNFTAETCWLINQLLKKRPPLRPANMALILKHLQ